MSTNAVEDTIGYKVFAGNLAYTVADDGLKEFFAPVSSDILSAQVITRGTRSAGYGFVTVKTLEAAQKACEQLDKKELEGRQVVVEVAKPAEQKDKERTERRAKRRAGRARGKAPPGEVTEAEASGDAEKLDSGNPTTGADTPASGGEGKRKPRKRRLPRKKSKKAPEAGESPTQASADPNGATADTEPATAPVSKKNLRPQREKRASRAAGENPTGEPSKTVLFVANLGFNVDDSGLSELFTSAGIKVISARIVRRRWGKIRKSKGYGFVDVGGEEEQKKAIAALQGKEVEGREIAVKVAVDAHTGDKEDDTSNGTPLNAKDASPEATIVAQ